MHLIPIIFLVASVQADDDVTRFRDIVPARPRVEVQPLATQDQFDQAAQAQDGRFGVELGLEIKRGPAGFRRVPLDTPICDGDQVAFRFTPSGAGYVTVLEHGTSGSWIQLEQAQDFSPASAARLPAVSGYEVEPPTGTEYLWLFLSPKPLSSQAVSFIDGIIRGAVAQGAAQPPIAYVRTRDIGGAASAYVVGQGEQTVAFSLTHASSCAALR